MRCWPLFEAWYREQGGRIQKPECSFSGLVLVCHTEHEGGYAYPETCSPQLVIPYLENNGSVIAQEGWQSSDRKRKKDT